MDGIGALLTAALTGLLLPAVHEHIGTPINTLIFLALIAFCFSLYSLACHFLLQPKRAIFLKLIMTANLLYCILTAALMYHHRDTIEPLGIAYFVGEIIVILILLYQESKALRTMTSQRNSGAMVLLPFMLLLADGAYAQRTILWEVKDTVNHKRSYLLGTYHYMGNAFVDSLPEIKKALLASELAVFESLEDGSALLEQMKKRKRSNSLKKILDKKDIKTLEALSKDWNISPYALEPVELIIELRASFLQRVCNTSKPSDPWDHFDNYLIHLAKENRIAMLGLETDSLQLQMLQDTYKYSWEDVKDDIVYYIRGINGGPVNEDDCALTNQYRAFTLPYALDEPCEDDPLIKDRNVEWMKILPGLLQSRNCFIAVGFLHLTNACGLITSLRSKGFVVESVDLDAK